MLTDASSQAVPCRRLHGRCIDRRSQASDLARGGNFHLGRHRHFANLRRRRTPNRNRSDSRWTPDSPGSRSRFEDSRVEPWSSTKSLVWRRCCLIGGPRPILRRSSLIGWKSPETRRPAPAIDGLGVALAASDDFRVACSHYPKACVAHEPSPAHPSRVPLPNAPTFRPYPRTGLTHTPSPTVETPPCSKRRWNCPQLGFRCGG